MTIAYIAHPIGGNVKENLKKIEAIGRKINLEEPEVLPFVSYFFDCHCLDDSIPEERLRGFKNNAFLFKKGFIDEIRLYGDRISVGMSYEIRLAKKLGITIKPMTEATIEAFKSYE